MRALAGDEAPGSASDTSPRVGAGLRARGFQREDRPREVTFGLRATIETGPSSEHSEVPRAGQCSEDGPVSMVARGPKCHLGAGRSSPLEPACPKPWAPTRGLVSDAHPGGLVARERAHVCDQLLLGQPLSGRGMDQALSPVATVLRPQGPLQPAAEDAGPHHRHVVTRRDRGGNLLDEAPQLLASRAVLGVRPALAVPARGAHRSVAVRPALSGTSWNGPAPRWLGPSSAR